MATQAKDAHFGCPMCGVAVDPKSVRPVVTHINNKPKIGNQIRLALVQRWKDSILGLPVDVWADVVPDSRDTASKPASEDVVSTCDHKGLRGADVEKLSDTIALCTAASHKDFVDSMRTRYGEDSTKFHRVVLFPKDKIMTDIIERFVS